MLISGEKPLIKEFQIKVKDNIFDAFRCIGASGKEVVAYNAPAEDILHIIKQNRYDCIFTSPPYFATELYDEGGDDWKQSWFRYSQYDNWWDKFYKPVMTACFESLSDNGIMMINIMDPSVNRKRYKTCDQMVDLIKDLGGKFDGQVGMRIMQRPKNIKSDDLKKHLSTTYIENIWCFSKKGFDLSQKPATLETIFGE
jgi:DNA modification methylase